VTANEDPEAAGAFWRTVVKIDSENSRRRYRKHVGGVPPWLQITVKHEDQHDGVR